MADATVPICHGAFARPPSLVVHCWSQVCNITKESSISVFQFNGSHGIMHRVKCGSSGSILFDHVLHIQGKLITFATNVFDAKLCCNAAIDQGIVTCLRNTLPVKVNLIAALKGVIDE